MVTTKDVRRKRKPRSGSTSPRRRRRSGHNEAATRQRRAGRPEEPSELNPATRQPGGDAGRGGPRRLLPTEWSGGRWVRVQRLLLGRERVEQRQAGLARDVLVVHGSRNCTGTAIRRGAAINSSYAKKPAPKIAAVMRGSAAVSGIPIAVPRERCRRRNRRECLGRSPAVATARPAWLATPGRPARPARSRSRR